MEQTTPPLHHLLFDEETSEETNLLDAYENHPYACLAVILGCLRGLAVIHQVHHWQSKGKSFFGDHLLYERLYSETFGDVDALAEKAVGLGTEDLVEPVTQLKQQLGFVNLINAHTNNDPARRSLFAEQAFMRCVKKCILILEDQDLYTDGLENHLQGMMDTHEGHVYLLKQRVGQS